MFAIKIADRDIYILAKKGPSREWCSATPENGRLAFLTSGRPAFRQHTEHAEGSDTSHVSHTQKALSAGCTNRNFGRSEKDHAAQRGCDAFGTATRISASLSRRLSAFFESTSRARSQSGKVRRSGTRPGDVRERAVRVEGSDSGPVRKAPVSPCVPLCAIFLREPSVYPLSPVKANVGRLCEKLKNAMKSGLEQRCDGNFWTIFAGTILGEKPNFTGRFSEW